MTREKIISGLQMTMDLIQFDPVTGIVRPIYTLNDIDKTTYVACKAAIEALKAQDVTDTNVGDTISRQSAIDAVKNADVIVLYHDAEPVEEAIEEAIEATKRSITTDIEGLSSAQLVDKDIDVPSTDTISRQAAIDVADELLQIATHEEKHKLSMLRGGAERCIAIRTARNH